jgi:carbon monoxide dehydrogenase subunit G
MRRHGRPRRRAATRERDVGPMKFTGEITVPAPRDAVYARVRDARFFASCVEGVQALTEVDADHYTAVLETKVAYLKFKFNVAVEVVRADPPREIAAKIEGTPLGIVGRLTATSLTRLDDDNGGTKVSYEVDAALTGKLGSLGQPVLRSKAKEMERQFALRLRTAFAEPEAAR